MRIVLAIVLINIVVMGSARQARAAQEDVNVTVRVHDYVNVDPRALLEAQRLVAKFYGAVGVRIRWMTTMPQHTRALAVNPGDGLEDLTIIILDRRTAADRGLPPNVVGSAAVGLGEIGRIAYVLYERVAHAAFASGWATGDLLAVVMAHELGHLLLPPGSHSPVGLMRAHWTIADLRRAERLGLAFSRKQGAQMREGLTGEARRRGAARERLRADREPALPGPEHRPDLLAAKRVSVE